MVFYKVLSKYNCLNPTNIPYSFFTLQGGIEQDRYGDKVAEVLIPLQEKVKHELEKSANEVDKARKAQAKVRYLIIFYIE